MSEPLQAALDGVTPFIPDILVLLGLTIITIGVYGALRMPDTYLRLHSTSVVVAFGVIAIALAALFTGDSAIAARVLLIVAVLGITAPISTFTMARAAFLRDERLEDGDAVDESGQNLAGGNGARGQPDSD